MIIPLLVWSCDPGIGCLRFSGAGLTGGGRLSVGLAAFAAIGDIKTGTLEDYRHRRKETFGGAVAPRAGNRCGIIKTAPDIKTRQATGAFVFIGGQILYLLCTISALTNSLQINPRPLSIGRG